MTALGRVCPLAIAACAAFFAAASFAADGRSDPPLFTRQQVLDGRSVYAVHCARCHGDALQGAAAGPLSGPAFAISWSVGGVIGNWSEASLSVDDLDYIIRTSMPRDAPGKLKPLQYDAVLSFILHENGYEAGPDPLRGGAAVLKRARLRFGVAREQLMAPPPARLAGDASAVPAGGGPTQQELNDAANSTRDWLYHTHDYAGTRYVPLRQIDTGNASKLRAVCAFQLGDEGNFQTGPIVYQGTMFVTTTRSTVALDATTCRPRWRYTWTPRLGEVWRNNRGVAIKDGYVVRGTSDGYLLALNARTGALVWAVRAAEAREGETFTMAPLIFDDMVIIGPAGSENAISGWVGAFRLKDGTAIWKFRTAPGLTDKTSASWSNPKGIKLGGGSVWTPFSLDPERGELIVAVANPAPDLPAGMRPGDNRYTDSAVALDVRTGELRWFHQAVPNDAHDWDLTQVSPLYSRDVDGQRHRYVGIAGKDGHLRALDLDTRQLAFSTPVTTIAHEDDPVTPDGVQACPGALGGVEWNGPAYQPGLNLLLVNAVDWCMKFVAARSVRQVPGRFYLGGSLEFAPTSQGWLTAVDATTGEVRWKYRSERPLVAAVTATAGDLVFTGELTGDFLALDARSGEVLYRFNTGGAIGGGIVTYEEGGKQYVAVMSGKPSAFWVNQVAGSPTVFLFALP